MNVLFMSMPVPEDMERDGMHIMRLWHYIF